MSKTNQNKKPSFQSNFQSQGQYCTGTKPIYNIIISGLNKEANGLLMDRKTHTYRRTDGLTGGRSADMKTHYFFKMVLNFCPFSVILLVGVN